jgi:hypothetical protein
MRTRAYYVSDRAEEFGNSTGLKIVSTVGARIML